MLTLKWSESSNQSLNECIPDEFQNFEMYYFKQNQDAKEYFPLLQMQILLKINKNLNKWRLK